MFNNLENQKLRIENENLKNQLKLKEIEDKQLEKQYEHKCNELNDVIADSFMAFNKLTGMTERNDYNKPEQKISQIKECVKYYRDYFAKMTLSSVKNRTTATDNN